MRHRVQGRKLKRTASHRKALLRALTTQLLRHKRIRTTEAKAKEARRFAEAVITRAKRAYLAEADGGNVNVHARRVVARDVNDSSVVHELFSEIAPKVAERPGGYTRVVKLPRRHGDGARLAVLELVDYNLEQDTSAIRTRSRKQMTRAERVARSKASQKQKESQTPTAEAAEAEADAAAEQAEVAEPQVEQTPDAGETQTPETETPTAEASEETASEEPKLEDSADDQKSDGNDDDDQKKS